MVQFGLADLLQYVPCIFTSCIFNRCDFHGPSFSRPAISVVPLRRTNLRLPLFHGTTPMHIPMGMDPMGREYAVFPLSVPLFPFTFPFL